MRKLHIPGRSNVIGMNSMAATSHPLSTIEAISILKRGGNAVDAAIAASIVQAVVEPNSTGIGGDCFALISMNGKKPVSVNGSGISPKKANIDFFKNNRINKISTTSPHSVNVPGALHAWHSIHNKYGVLDFEQLFKSAENYARNGYPVHEVVAKSWNENIDKLKKYKNTESIYLKKGQPYKYGEIHKNIKLAETLKSISKKGIRDFYQGYIAEDIVNSLNSIGGLHTLDDFIKQDTIFSDSVNKTYKKIKIHQCPPNGPGITVLIMMGILEQFDFSKIDPLSFERFHLQAEATKLAYEQRESYLADPNFSDFNFNRLIENNFIEKLASKISFNDVYRAKNFTVTAHPETIYLSVVDKDLNSVSFINSICFPFGSGITTNQTGILLQNRGVNFRLEKNHPNVIEGNKRPLHTIIPGLVTDISDNTILSYGVMGGQYQPVGHTHVLQNIFDFGLSIQESIDFPRAFMLENKYLLEKSIPSKILEKLNQTGHNSEYSNTHGGGQAIYIDRVKGTLTAGSDPRKDGCAIGY